MRLLVLGAIGIALAAVAVLATASPVFAGQGFDGASYFEGSYSSVFITAGSAEPSGNSSGVGYVMPNRHAACGFGGWCPHAGGNGAIGWKALGYSNQAAANAAGDQDRKLKLYCFLENRNGRSTKRADCSGWSPTPASSTTDWERMGSAVVVYQLLGQSGKGRGGEAKKVSTEDWDDLYNRLMNPELRMRSTDGATNANNTTGVWANGQLDARDYWFSGSDLKTVPAWVFSKTSGGGVQYSLEVSCANGLGGLGLDTYTIPDPDEYELTPTLDSPADGDTVERNEKISASATVVNEGDKAGVKSWYISRYKAGTSSGAKTGACDGLPGSGCTSTPFSHDFTAEGTPNAEDSGSMSAFTIPSSAKEGDEYCWVASVSRPTHNTTPAWGRSATHCVTVTKQYTLTPSITGFDATIEDEDGEETTNPAPYNSAVPRGAKLTIKNRVRNNGPDTSRAGRRVITRIAYKASANPSLAASPSNDIGCDAFPSVGRFNSGALGCSGIQNVSEAALGTSIAERDRNRNTEDVYEISAEYTVGTKVCFVVSVSRFSEDASTSQWKHSPMRCVTVKRDFTLIPSIDNVLGRSDGDVIVPGEDSDIIRHSVENGGLDESTGVLWRLTYFVYSPGSNLGDRSEQKESSQVPCEAFSDDGRTICTNNNPPGGWAAENTVKFAADSTEDEQITYETPDNLAVGTKVCWVASVSPPTVDSDATDWRHSAMHCLVIGKKPKVQVWGGDVRSGGGITTSISTIKGKTYGSWVEYAALSNKKNDILSSGANLNDGKTGSDRLSWSRLTFANTGTASECDEFGCFGFSSSIPSLSAQFVSADEDPSLSGTVDDLNAEASGRGVHVFRAGSVRLAETTIGYGKTIVIVASGTVTIEGNISYQNRDYENIQELPQLIIKAPKIDIENDATRVDAWLLAVGSGNSGELNTCSSVALNAKLTDEICDKRLTINGPVVADTVHLRRTAGSGVSESQRGDPAEIFNLRADAYMWASAFMSRTNQIQTVYSKELSPRF